MQTYKNKKIRRKKSIFVAANWRSTAYVIPEALSITLYIMQDIEYISAGNA